MARENSLHDATYVYLTVERAVLGELSQRVQNWALEHLGPAWLSVFLAKPENHKVLGWKDPADPFYMLKAFSKIPNTPLLKAVEQGPNLVELAGDVFHTRNLWAHHSHDQQMLSIKGDIRALMMFAQSAGLDSAQSAQEALTQLIKITAGAAPVQAPSVSEAQSETETASEAEAPQRPRIGSAWSDELPSGQIDLNSKLRDALDPETGATLRDRWPSPELAKAAIDRWFALKPTTPRLLYDERDGATVGFLEGFPYLFGYIGPEPETPPEQYRGFLGDTTYLFRSSELIAQGSGKSLTISSQDWQELTKILAEREIEDGEAFRVSNYNDLVHLSDQGPLRVFTLSS